MNIEDKLIKKSEEAFLLAIEIFNKPTIKYRTESFVFLICNAWELMLKAYLIKKRGYSSIYLNNDFKKTLSLRKCISLVFTNNKDPLRLNLEKIIELRDTSTHFITEEYEMIYIPLFQSCIFNYNEKMMLFHNVDISEIVNENFLTITPTMRALNQTEIIAKYPDEIANKIVSTSKSINSLISQNNNNFAIVIEHFHYLTKNEAKATSKIKIDNSSQNVAKIIREQTNPNTTHKYTTKKCIEEINKLLRKNKISLISNGIEKDFNSYHFNLFSTYYNFKNNPKLCFIYNISTQPRYSYSYQTIEFIFNEIKKDPNNIIDNIKKSIKKSTLGAKEF